MANPRDSAHRRFTRIAEENLDAAWRVAKRCGVPSDQLDDVVQETFIVVCRRLNEITKDRERAFVLGTTMRVCANWRRSARRRPEDPQGHATDYVGVSEPTQESEVVQHQGLRLLDSALSSMTDVQREVFVLTELEQLTAREVSEQLQIQEAAVVSRLRRARETFKAFCTQWQQAVNNSEKTESGAIYDA